MTKAYNIDCMGAMREMKDNQFDLAIVDAPYFSGPEKRGYYGRKKSRAGVPKEIQRVLIIVQCRRYS